jgi:hypothetical protein
MLAVVVAAVQLLVVQVDLAGAVLAVLAVVLLLTEL